MSYLCHTVASRREKAKAQKKEYKVYTKLTEQEDQCKQKMASCETRDVRARQVKKLCVMCVHVCVCGGKSLFIPNILGTA